MDEHQALSCFRGCTRTRPWSTAPVFPHWELSSFNAQLQAREEDCASSVSWAPGKQPRDSMAPEQEQSEFQISGPAMATVNTRVLVRPHDSVPGLAVQSLQQQYGRHSCYLGACTSVAQARHELRGTGTHLMCLPFVGTQNSTWERGGTHRTNPEPTDVQFLSWVSHGNFQPTTTVKLDRAPSKFQVFFPFHLT